MADVRMVHHRHAETRIVRHVATQIVAILIVAILIVGVARTVADQTARRREEILIAGRLENGAAVVIATAVVIGDPADLRTWIATADLQKVVTLSADRIAAMQKAVHQKAAASLAEAKDHRLAAKKVEGALDLRCRVAGRRSQVVDPVQADLRGHSEVSRLVADLRSVVADKADLKWDRRG